MTGLEGDGELEDDPKVLSLMISKREGLCPKMEVGKGTNFEVIFGHVEIIGGGYKFSSS